MLQLPPISVVASNMVGKKFINIPLFRIFTSVKYVTYKLHKYYRNVTQRIVTQVKKDNNGNVWKEANGHLVE